MLKARIYRAAAISVLLVAAQGCASTAPSGASGAPGASSHSVVAAAQGVVGAPYRYGGYTPAGFDCSGLVFYAHRQAGIRVPRTTGAQLHRARPVALDDLRAGDVLFFELEGKKVSHVGIYAGGDSFIHAPSSGKSVSYATLQTEFWSSRLLSAGRFD